MAEARAAVAAVLVADVGRHRADPCHDRRDEHRRVVDRLEGRRSRRDDHPRASGRHGWRSTTCAIGSASSLRSSTSGRGVNPTPSSPPSTRRSTSGPGWWRSRTCCGPPARSCRSPRSRRWPTPAARSWSWMAPRAPARSHSSCRPRAPTCTRYSAQKWLLGPEGMGAIAVAPGVRERLQPTFGGHFTFETVTSDGTAVRWPDARKFESSSFHRPSIVGMARSIGWLSMFVGLDWVYARGTAMARLAADRLAAIDGVEVVTPRDRMATLVTFRIARLAGRSRARRARCPGLRDRPDRAARRRAAHQRGLLHLRGGARSAGRGGRAAGRPYAGDAAAASGAHDARRGMTAPPGRGTGADDRAGGPLRSGSARGARSAGASSGMRRGRSCAPCCPASSWPSSSRSSTSGMTWHSAEESTCPVATCACWRWPAYVLLVLVVGTRRHVPRRPATDRLRHRSTAERLERRARLLRGRADRLAGDDRRDTDRPAPARLTVASVARTHQFRHVT